MAISKETEAEIARLFLVEKWRIGTIATQLSIHHTTVERVLDTLGVPRPDQPPRKSIADPYVPLIQTTLDAYPKLPASRLFQMAKERGYPGSEGHFRRIVARHRPVKSRAEEAYLRLRTLPGEQGQVDWGHFGKITIGKAKRWLMAFVLVLSFSRYIFLRFFTNQRLPVFLRGHVLAFEAIGGVPRSVLYDNPKTIVLERDGSAIRFHPRLLEFTKHYCYEPRPVAVARGNQKGRVERSIRYVRDSFWPARTFRDLDDLNAQAAEWCEDVAAARPWPEDRSITVRQAFEQEKDRLLPLPKDAYVTDERVEVKSGKTPYVRFDLNDYSIPHTHVRRVLTVVASSTKVRVLAGDDVVATHDRSYDKAQQIEDEAHIAALTAEKEAARRHRGQDRLRQAAPNAEALLCAAADRGENLGSITSALLRLLEEYGACEFEVGITEALERDVPHPHAVRQCLERRRRERNLPPPVRLALPDNPQIRESVVRPHDLKTYDIEEDRDGQEDA
ncbi:MAG TPA: IS21 family transposase [Polyangiaceae bacterium]|nr:IS21 family transposase [Polyangiaceae bacterium]